MSKELIYLASMVNVLNLEVCKTYSIRSARKVSLFKNFVWPVFLSVACSLLTAMSVAYGGEGYALEVGGGRTVTIDDDKDVLRLSSYTYEFWMKDLQGPTGSWRNVFYKGSTNSSWGRGPLLALRPNESGLHFDHSTGTGQSTVNTYEGIPVNEWVHVAIALTALDGKQIIYQGGVQAAERSGVNLTDATQPPVLQMGVGANVVLDDFRVWNYARTQAEIQADMNREISGDEEGLVGYWRFNEGEGTTAYDTSPYENHGALVGATWTKDTAPVAPGRPPVFASRPYPASGATDVPLDVVLGWRPGAYAATRDVYFGTVFADVNDASRANPLGVLASQNQSADSFDPIGLLEFGQTYYWRVDEVNNVNPKSPWTGHVWSFATELFAYPIDGNDITATASSAHAADTGPENTINGSGLDDNDLHSNEETDMWLSSTEALGAWIEYEFDKIYKLHQMWVWNSNQVIEPLLGFGLKDVTIEYSTNGTDYTTLGTTHEFARAPGADGYEHNTTVDLSGVVAKYVRLTANSNWGGIMPQYGLSEVRFFHIPVYARNPYPDSGATDVDVDVVLSWRAGREAASHDVYFSDSNQAVIDGTAPVTTVTEAKHGPLSLDLGKTYYWRVDEVNEAETPATWQGGLWDFTTQEYFVVDDFESYNDLDTTNLASKRIFNVWVDGYQIPTNGSLVGYENPPFCEQTIVHSGKQSMPLFYNNTGGAAYSEAELTLTPPQDWTKAGIATLVLYFHGVEGNTGQLYVKLNGSKVVYDGDAGDIAKPQWKHWNIELASVGVNLQNVTKLSIGIDDNGAGGTLYVDDIRLYRLAPEPQAN
jgi:hypothetical protein